jgi:hypothetical protein
MGADVDSNGNFRIRRKDGENILCAIFHQADTTNNPDAVRIIQEGTGKAISVRAAADGSDVFSVDKSGNVAAEGTLTVTNVEAGGTLTVTGVITGSSQVDLSGVAGNVFKLPGTAISTAGTLSYQIPIDIGGVTYYLYAYTAGA